MIETGPYIRQTDMAVSCAVLTKHSEYELCTRHVTWKMLEELDLSAEELFKRAAENSRHIFKPVIEPMKDIILKIIAENIVHKEDKTSEEITAETEMIYERIFGVPFERIDEVDLYILTNTLKIRGAAAVYYTDILDEFSNLVEDDLIMLPSSIHEWLILPKRFGGTPESYREMVYRANRSVVAENEILSEWVYQYSRKNHTIELLEGQGVFTKYLHINT